MGNSQLKDKDSYILQVTSVI